MTRRLVLVLSLSCAVAVGNLYFPQAITPLIAAGLGASPEQAGIAVTATQVGYTIGMFLVVPLCDRVPHRTLIVVLLSITGLALLAAAASTSLLALVALSGLIGTTTLAAQVAGPLAARLAGPRRGEVTGVLLSGSVGGMLLSRTAGGALGEWLGWRTPYLVAGLVTLLLAATLAYAVPITQPASRRPYPALLAESLRLLRDEPALRRSCLYQATVFAGFSAVWTCVALLITGPTYRLGAPTVGVLALVGAATMVATPFAGRQVDRRGPDVVNLVCFLGLFAAAAILSLGAVGGVVGMTALVGGTLLLDVTMQCGMVANQARVYAIRPEAGGRLNTGYMTCAYAGGGAGSFLGIQCYAVLGWSGVCALAAILAGVALTHHLRQRVRGASPRRVPATTKPQAAVRPTRA